MELLISLVPRFVLGRRTSSKTTHDDDVDRHDDAPTPQRRRRHTSDDTLVVHAGERRRARAISGVEAEATDYSIATPIVTGTARWFRDSADLVAFREGGGRRWRWHSFEYARYGNPTVEVLEDKISAMEKAEATIVTSSGMNAIVVTLLAVVPPGGHTTFVDLDDMEALQSVLDQGNVTMFYADSLTNPHLKCVDVRRVAELCHQRGALVCIDSTLASPINQKPLTLGADVVLHSITKYIAGHHDVIAGCVSGSEELISRIRELAS
uniref:Cystathionine gamma-synthase n=1 Tax=Oryza barthii TaxID=65489 RepID=A0A0D3GES1_9ORYZ